MAGARMSRARIQRFVLGLMFIACATTLTVLFTGTVTNLDPHLTSTHPVGGFSTRHNPEFRVFGRRGDGATSLRGPVVSNPAPTTFTQHSQDHDAATTDASVATGGGGGGGGEAGPPLEEPKTTREPPRAADDTTEGGLPLDDTQTRHDDGSTHPSNEGFQPSAVPSATVRRLQRNFAIFGRSEGTPVAPIQQAPKPVGTPAHTQAETLVSFVREIAPLLDGEGVVWALNQLNGNSPRPLWETHTLRVPGASGGLAHSHGHEGDDTVVDVDRLVKRVMDGVVHGVLNSTSLDLHSTLKDFLGKLNSRESGVDTFQWYDLVKPALEAKQATNATIVEFGCFSHKHLLPLKLGMAFPKATVLAIHVCPHERFHSHRHSHTHSHGHSHNDGASTEEPDAHAHTHTHTHSHRHAHRDELGVMAMLRERLGLRNVHIITSELSSAFVNSLKAVMVASETACDYALVSELAQPSNMLIPFEYERLMADVLSVCNVTMLPSSLPKDRFFSYWGSTTKLIESVKRHVRTAQVTSDMVKKSSSVSSSSSSSSRSYTTSSASTYSSYRSSYTSSRTSTGTSPHASSSSYRSSTSSSSSSASAYFGLTQVHVSESAFASVPVRRDGLPLATLTLGMQGAGGASHEALGSRTPQVLNSEYALLMERVLQALQQCAALPAGDLRSALDTSRFRIVAHRVLIDSSFNCSEGSVAMLSKNGEDDDFHDVSDAGATKPLSASSVVGSAEEARAAGSASTFEMPSGLTSEQRASLAGFNLSQWKPPDTEVPETAHFAGATSAIAATTSSSSNTSNQSSSSSSASASSLSYATSPLSQLFRSSDAQTTTDASAASAASAGALSSGGAPSRRLLSTLLSADPYPNRKPVPLVHDGPFLQEFRHRDDHPQGYTPSFSLSGDEENQQLSMIEFESASFTRLWPHLQEEVHARDAVRPFESVALFGSDQSMLAIKLAQMSTESTVLSVHLDTSFIDSHLKLIELMDVKNNVIAATALCPTTLARVAVANDPFDLSVVTQTTLTHIFAEALRSSTAGLSDASSLCPVDFDALEATFGTVLALGHRTLVDLPRMDTLEKLVHMFAPAVGDDSSCSEAFAARYRVETQSSNHARSGSSGAFIRRSEFVCAEERFLVACLSAVSSHAVRIKVLDDRASMLSNPRAPLVVRITQTESPLSVDALDHAVNGGISVHTLLAFNILPKFKASIFRMFLALPFWRYSSLPSVTPVRVRLHVENGVTRLSVAVKAAAPVSATTGAAAGGTAGKVGDVIMTSSGGFTLPDATDDGAETGVRGDGGDDEVQTNDSDDYMREAFWKTLHPQISKPEENSNGRFSFLELFSGSGALSMNVAREYPNATVVSVEPESARSDAHLEAMVEGELFNNQVCTQGSSVVSTLVKNLYESPEFFRFQVFSRSLIEEFISGEAKNAELSRILGTLMSTGLSTFFHMPSSKVISLAMSMFFPDYLSSECDSEHHDVDSFFGHHGDDDGDDFVGGDSGGAGDGAGEANPYLSALERPDSVYNLAQHPSEVLRDIDLHVLRTNTKTPTSGWTEVSVSRVAPPAGVAGLPLIRCDIRNMTRKVHHHFDYAKDGHKRTYTMYVNANATTTTTALRALGRSTFDGLGFRDTSLGGKEAAGTRRYIYDNPQRAFRMPDGYHVNNDELVQVYLIRDQSTHKIPYNTIHVITLIAALRMGLRSKLKERAYGEFLKLPLYEDMAPWNIVFQGAVMDYIDYDTREVTFDEHVKRAYQILAVLMNYKRTVQDFSKCGDKASNPYGFSWVSECVRSNEFKGPCDDPTLPVPCGDGKCHSDYISCLRAVVEIDDTAAAAAAAATASGAATNAIKSVEDTGRIVPRLPNSHASWRFDQSGLKEEASSRA